MSKVSHSVLIACTLTMHYMLLLERVYSYSHPIIKFEIQASNSRREKKIDTEKRKSINKIKINKIDTDWGEADSWHAIPSTHGNAERRYDLQFVKIVTCIID